MKQKILGFLLMGAFAIASTSTFVSCKDYDDDINSLRNQINDITKQNLQTQITTLSTALDEAKTKASEAAAAAATAQSAADAAQTSANAAQTSANAANAAITAAAAQQDVDDLEQAINDLKAIVDGKLSADALDAAIKDVEAKIVAIDGKLLTLDDVETLLSDKDFATNAVVKDLESQIQALQKIGLTEEWKKNTEDAIASLTQIKTDIETNATGVAEAKKAAEAATKVVAEVSNDIINLNVFVKRLLTSLVLRPDTYYGGIEGISVYAYEVPEEQNAPEKLKNYSYFDRKGTINISDRGEARYHVNPTYVDLTDYSIDFYNWVADIKEPVATERVTPTRSGETGITPVFKTTEELLADNKDNLKNGILTVPFEANTAVIEQRLNNGKGTIASLSLTKKGIDGAADSTVNSDYAVVVPEYGYGLLIGDNTFPVTTRHLDQIGYDGGAVNSSNLHRSFSFLALASTSATHAIKYDESFDITKVLEARYCPKKEDYTNEITDTAINVSHSNHQPIARWNGTTLNKEQDGDASIDKSKVVTMSKSLFERLGFKWEIQLVNYTLGSNKTGETVHLELITDEETGHVIAYPRNVTADGQTIKGQVANAACVGRQPIVCILIKDKQDRIVSFAYMKFLITPEPEQVHKDKEVTLNVNDIWVNCKDKEGRVTWSEIERNILDLALEGMSKKDFDKNYVFDFYSETTEDVKVDDATYNRTIRYGVQYDKKNGKRIDETKSFGSIQEQFDLSSQHVEDATTHIIKWQFTDAQLKDKAEALRLAGKLEDKGDYYVNKEEIVTWVRYAHLSYTPGTDTPAIGATAEKGNPSIWVKLTIPAGEFHVAKGDMGANKILTYWYAMNSKQNAADANEAFEVRINVPVPVPEASAEEKVIGYSIADNATKLDIRYDNLLEMAADPIAKRTEKTYSEFTKNIKDFFIGGKLSASVKDAQHFGTITGMKLGCEFTLPSTTAGNATFNAGTNNGIANSWVVNGYSGAKYTLILNADRTKIQIKAKNTTTYPTPVDLVTLNYDDNTVVTDRQITVLNYVNGVDQDDILNYKTHNELAERETFTAYLNIKAIDACAPVFWDNMLFNARFIRPLDLENPLQAVVPDAPNDWHEIDLTDALIVKDWREYYGDRLNRTQGRDVTEVIPNVNGGAPVKAFDFEYYQVDLEIDDAMFYTDAHKGAQERGVEVDPSYTPGKMITIENEADAKSKGYIKTSDVPNLKLEKISSTKLRYLNNSGVTGGFHVFVPITMTYVYGYMTVRQTKWTTIGVTSSVEQAMIGGGN